MRSFSSLSFAFEEWTAAPRKTVMRKHDITGERISALFICPSRKNFWVVPGDQAVIHRGELKTNVLD